MKKEKNFENQNLDPMATEAQVTEAVTTDEAKAIEEAKAKKRESAKKWAENKKAEKAARKEKAAQIIEKLKAGGAWDQLDDSEKKFFIDESNGQGATNSLFNKVFGDNPKVGDSITLQTFMEKTLKGKSQLDFYVKNRWAERGITVIEKPNADIRMTEYVIEALPTA